ncbi:hypothetical protein D3C76_1299320 [compost metagenome]
MERWQNLSPGLGHDAKLVVGHDLEQRLSQKTKALYLFRWCTEILSLVILTQSIDGLLYQRLSSLDHSNEGSLVHLPCSGLVDASL